MRLLPVRPGLSADPAGALRAHWRGLRAERPSGWRWSGCLL